MHAVVIAFDENPMQSRFLISSLKAILSTSGEGRRRARGWKFL
jgi:hypothetical protein